jgi:hypothetical protein
MNIRKLALFALLGGALMAFGCGDDATENGGGGSGGSGEGGSGGDGAGGSGGTVAEDPGLYGFSCALATFDLPVTIKINAEDPGFTEGAASDLTSTLDYIVAPDIIDLLPTLAPDAMISETTSTVGVTGGTPAEISPYTVAGLPIAPTAEFSSEPNTTAITPTLTTVGLAVTAMSATITGIPDALVPGGTLTLAPAAPVAAPAAPVAAPAAPVAAPAARAARTSNGAAAV